MVTTTTRAGLVVGHGHVRSGDNHRTTTRLQPGAYRLRIEARGYEPVTVDDVVIPAADEPATRVAADLDPAADYPFPDEVALPPAGAPRPPRPAGATLLRGTAVEIPPVEPGAPQPPPQPLRGVRVFAPGAPASVSGRTGGWVLAFRPGTPAGPVDVTLSASGKTPQTVTADLVPGYRQTLDVVEMTDA